MVLSKLGFFLNFAKHHQSTTFKKHYGVQFSGNRAEMASILERE